MNFSIASLTFWLAATHIAISAAAAVPGSAGNTLRKRDPSNDDRSPGQDLGPRPNYFEHRVGSSADADSRPSADVLGRIDRYDDPLDAKSTLDELPAVPAGRNDAARLAVSGSDTSLSPEAAAAAAAEAARRASRERPASYPGQASPSGQGEDGADEDADDAEEDSRLARARVLAGMSLKQAAAILVRELAEYNQDPLARSHTSCDVQDPDLVYASGSAGSQDSYKPSEPIGVMMMPTGPSPSAPLDPSPADPTSTPTREARTRVRRASRRSDSLSIVSEDKAPESPRELVSAVLVFHIDALPLAHSPCSLSIVDAMDPRSKRTTLASSSDCRAMLRTQTRAAIASLGPIPKHSSRPTTPEALAAELGRKGLMALLESDAADAEAELPDLCLVVWGFAPQVALGTVKCTNCLLRLAWVASHPKHAFTTQSAYPIHFDSCARIQIRPASEPIDPTFWVGSSSGAATSSGKASSSA
nr:hypothetical protein HK105_003836 [Polyrhizophydium stewartii]